MDTCGLSALIHVPALYVLEAPAAHWVSLIDLIRKYVSQGLRVLESNPGQVAQ